MIKMKNKTGTSGACCRCCTPSLAKRFIVSLTLGLGFGVLCAYLASRSDSSIFDWHNPLFWSIVANRFLIGFTVFFAGWMHRHPLLGFQTPAFLRGFCIGAIVSLTMAFGSLVGSTDPQSLKIFWLTILIGGFYGLVIDVIASRCGGQSKELFVQN